MDTYTKGTCIGDIDISDNFIEDVHVGDTSGISAIKHLKIYQESS